MLLSFFFAHLTKAFLGTMGSQVLPFSSSSGLSHTQDLYLFDFIDHTPCAVMLPCSRTGVHILATQHLGLDNANTLITLTMGVPTPWDQKQGERRGMDIH